MRIRYTRYIVALTVGIALLSGCAAHHQASDKSHALPGTPGYYANNKPAKTYGLSGGNQVDADGRHVNVMYAPANQTYYFGFDSSTLRPDALAAIAMQGKYLSLHPQAKIKLEGNTDDRGSREYNVALGWRRDQSVKKLLRQQGVRNSQIEMVSYGEERPAVAGHTNQARMLNRQVNIVYTEVPKNG